MPPGSWALDAVGASFITFRSFYMAYLTGYEDHRDRFVGILVAGGTVSTIGQRTTGRRQRWHLAINSGRYCVNGTVFVKGCWTSSMDSWLLSHSKTHLVSYGITTARVPAALLCGPPTQMILSSLELDTAVSVSMFSTAFEARGTTMVDGMP